MCWVFVAIVKLTHGYILILFWFLFINDCFCETTCMDMRYFVFVCACAQDLKLFNYSAELMLLHCVSSSNLIVLSHSPQSFSPLSLSLHFHPFFFCLFTTFFFFLEIVPLSILLTYAVVRACVFFVGLIVCMWVSILPHKIVGIVLICLCVCCSF